MRFEDRADLRDKYCESIRHPTTSRRIINRVSEEASKYRLVVHDCKHLVII